MRGEPIEGCLRIVKFQAGADDDPRAQPGRTVAAWLGCVSPNTYVIGIDERHHVAVLHQLIRDELPPGAGPPRMNVWLIATTVLLTGLFPCVWVAMRGSIVRARWRRSNWHPPSPLSAS